MELLNFLPFILTLAIFASVPGPGVAALVGKALGSGFYPALYFLLGLILGDITYLTLAILGLAAISSIFAWFFVIIKYLGALYLLFLAYRFWHFGLAKEQIAKDKQKGFSINFITGYLISLSNPKVIIFYLALLPSVVNLANVSLNDYLILISLTAMVLFIVIMPYILLATGAKELLRSERYNIFWGKIAVSAMAGAGAFIILENKLLFLENRLKFGGCL